VTDYEDKYNRELEFYIGFRIFKIFYWIAQQIDIDIRREVGSPFVRYL
jgi:hypothetical protein